VGATNYTITSQDITNGYVTVPVYGTPQLNANLQPISSTSLSPEAKSTAESSLRAAGYTPLSVNNNIALPAAMQGQIIGNNAYNSNDQQDKDRTAAVLQEMYTQGKTANPTGNIGTTGSTVATEKLSSSPADFPNTALNQTGQQIAAQNGEYYDSNPNSAGYGQIFSKWTGDPRTSIVDTFATEQARGVASGGLWVSSDPTLAACDSVFYGLEQVKEFSENGVNEADMAASQASGDKSTSNESTSNDNNSANNSSSTNNNDQNNQNNQNQNNQNNQGNQENQEPVYYCPNGAVCLPGADTTIPINDNGNTPICGQGGWQCIFSTTAYIPADKQFALELRNATMTMKNAIIGASANLMSALEKTSPQNPFVNDPPQIINFSPRISNGKDVTIVLQTDTKAICKISVKNQRYDEMENTLTTDNGLNHSWHIGPQNDGTYIYYAMCKSDKGLLSDGYIFVWSVDKNYDPRVENDKNPPALANIAVSNATAKEGVIEIISAQVGDNVGVQDVLAHIKNSANQLIAVASLSSDKAVSGGIWNNQFDTTAMPAGSYSVSLIASDKAGNFSRLNNAASFSISAKTLGVKNDGANNVCKPLLANGNSSQKLDVVFIPCGFGDETAAFENAAQAAADNLLGVLPLSNHKQKFNITLAEIPDLVCSDKLAANMDYDASRFTTAAQVCSPDVVVVIKKNGEDGGISLPGSRIAFILAADPFLTAHEIGHAFFRLNDEYSYGCTAADLTLSFNCDNSPKCVKFKDLEMLSALPGVLAKATIAPLKPA